MGALKWALHEIGAGFADVGFFAFPWAFTPEVMEGQMGFFDEVFAKRPGDEDDFTFKSRVARYAQDAVERVTAHQLRALEERTDRTRLLLEGGLALNCVNNAKLLAGSRQFEDLHVSFGASDVGVAIGAGYHAVRELGERPVHVDTPYLGPAFDADDVMAALREYTGRVEWREPPEESLAQDVAKLCTPRDALECFLGTEMDHLVLGHVIVSKPFSARQER